MSTSLTLRVRASLHDCTSGLFLFGNVAELSEWGALTPLPLSYVDGAFKGTIALPAHTEIQYKYVFANGGTIVSWEDPPFLNRILKTGKQGTAMHVEDGDFDSDQHVAVRVVEQERSGIDADQQLSSDGMGESLGPAFSDSSMHSDLQDVYAGEVRTVSINRDEDETRGKVGREKWVKEQETVKKHDSFSAIAVSGWSSRRSEDRGPVPVAGDAVQGDAPQPGQQTLVRRKKGALKRAFELTLRSFVSFSARLFFGKGSERWSC